MSSYHYLYRITNVVENKHYYGSRTCHDRTPQEDLGIKYFSSSSDKEFIRDQKQNPRNYRYKIIVITKTREKAILLECRIHRRFAVSRNPLFYNKSIQTSKNFCVFGMIVVKDENGNRSLVSINNPFYLSGELVGINKGNTHTENTKEKLRKFRTGKVNVKDKNGNKMTISVDDPRYKSKELVPIDKDKVTVKDKNGKFKKVSNTDCKYLSGELVGINKGLKMPKGHQSGKRNSQYGTCWINNGKENKKIKKDDPIPEGFIKGRKIKFPNP
jgi:hypothetical protein